MTLSPIQNTTLAAFLAAPLPSISLHVDGQPTVTAETLQAAIRAALAPAPRAAPRRSGPAVGTAGALLAALNRVVRAVEARSLLPVLACVRLTVGGGVATLQATDMKRCLTETVPWPAEAAAADGLINAAWLRAALRALAGHLVSPVLAAGHWTIGGSRLVADIPLEDWPSLKYGDYLSHWTMSAAALRRLLETTAPCMSTEPTRHYLNGVYLHLVGDQLRAVATDGHRLAWADTPVPAGCAVACILPTATVNDLLVLLPTGDETVEIAASDTRVRVRCGGTEILTKLIDGTFPEYSRVVPQRDRRAEMRLESAPLVAAIKRAAAVSSSKSPRVKLAWANGVCTVSCSDPERGTASAEVSYTGHMPTFEKGFQARYLLTMLASLAAPSAWCCFGGDDGCPIVAGVPDDDSVGFVLLPMRA